MEESRDEREARAAVDRYVDATYRGDVEALRACFHPSAAMSGYLGEELLTGGPQRFFDDVASTPSMQSTGAPYEAKVTSVQIVGRAASIRLDETGFFGSFSFSNWFHLIKDDTGSWLIVSKLFSSRAAGEPETTV